MDHIDNHNIKMSAGMNIQTLEKLAHLFGTCLYKLNLNTKDINLNLNTTKITGHNLTDLPNNDDTKDSMIHADDRDLVNNSIYSIISGQSDHYHIEYRMYRKDASIVWIEEVGIISEYDEEGRPLYMSAIAADLSRLKWAEEKARNMELEVKRLATSMDNHSLTEENRLLRASNAAAAMIIGGFHQDYETVLHQSLQMLCESIQANCVCIWRNMKRHGNMCCFLRAHWTKEAHTIGAENNKLLFVYNDFLPEWKELLSENNHAILEGNTLPHEFMRACDMDGAKSVMLVPLYLHSEFWGMVGFAREEDIPFAAYEADAMLSGAIIIASSVSRNETFGKINMDRDKAVANTLAKGEFLSRMSHELRTPLNAIIGMTDIALREKDARKIPDYLRKVEVSSHLLLNIINDVLDISKIDAGKLEIVKEPFDFNGMLKNAENIVKVKMDEKKQHFTVNFDESITNKVISDEHRLLQVIVNLLNNAMKFTPEKGEISLTASQKKIHNNNPFGRVKLRVEVRDSGIGLTPQQQEKLFTAFEQADGSITRKYGGTGLGLAICKKILNTLGGDIWVISKPDQGACFFFELEADLGKPLDNIAFPVNDASNLSYAASPDKAPDHSDPNRVIAGDEKDFPYDWYGRTVLLAEDVEINREIVEIMLSDTGINLICAENGKEAVEKFMAEPDRYDLILMDIQMPVLDGLGATKQLRSSDNPRAVQIPIIAMTANAFKEDIDTCIDAGMDCHISKPITIDSFFKVLAQYLK